MVLTAHPPQLLQLTEGAVEPCAAGVDHEKDLEHSSLILVLVGVIEHLLLPQRVVHDVEVDARHEQDRELMGSLHNFVMDRQPALPIPCHAGQHVARVRADHVAAVVRLERARCLVLLGGVDRGGGG